MKKDYKKLKKLFVFMTMLILAFGGTNYELSVSAATKNKYGLKNPSNKDGVVTWDCIYFGNYRESYFSDKKTPIKWRVLSVNGKDAFIMADKCLDTQPYNTTDADVTWETCTLRSWLNTTFINTAFNDEEKKSIIETTVVNEDNPNYGTNGGNNTIDKVFLLSANDISNENYGFLGKANEANATKVAKVTNYTIWQSDQNGDCYASSNGGAFWRVRTIGGASNKAASFNYDGILDLNAHVVTCNRHPIRPVLHLDLSRQDTWSYFGTVTSKDVYTESTLEVGNGVTSTSIVTSNNYYGFIVLDKETGEPVTNVTWWKDFDLQKNTTGEKSAEFGFKTETGLEERHTIHVEKSGYNPTGYTDNFKFGDGKTIPILLEPYNGGVFVETMKVSTERKDGKTTDEIDVMQYKRKWVDTLNDKYIDIDVTGGATDDNQTFDMFEIAQTEYSNEEIPTYDIIGKYKANASCRLSIDKFCVGDSVYVRGIDNNGKKGGWQKTNLMILCGLGEDFKSIDFGKDLSFEMPDKIPVIGGKKFNIEGWKDLPVQTYIDQNTIRIGINIAGMDSDGETESAFSDKKWNEIKKWSTDVNNLKDSKLSKKFKEFQKQRGDAYKRDAFSINDRTDSTKLSVDVWGYLEGNFGGKENEVSGKIVVVTSISESTCIPYSIGNIPMVFTINLHGKITDEITAKSSFVDLKDLNNNLVVGGSIESEIGIEVGTGPGFGDLGYIAGTVDGTVSTNMEVENLIDWSGPEVTSELTVSAGITAKLMFWSASVTLAESKFQLYPRNDSSDNSFNSLMDQKQYALNLNESFYYSNDQSQKTFLETGLISALNDGTLICQSIESDSKVFIANINGVKMAIYTVLDSDRADINKAKLVYSVYDEATNTWKEPKSVNDDGTCDYYPCVVHDSDNIYIAWVNLKSVLNSEEVTMESSAAATEIMLAKYNIENDVFDTIFTTDNQKMDYAPSLSMIDDKVYLTWISNINNNLLCNDNGNSIELLQISKKGEKNHKTVVSDCSNVLETASGIIGDEEYIAIIDDIDGDYLTVEDRKLNVYSIDGKLLSVVNDANAISYVSFYRFLNKSCLLWCQDGLLYYMDDTKEEPALFIDDTAKIQGRYKVEENNSSVYVMYLAEDEDGSMQDTSLYAYIYDKQLGVWSENTQISDDCAYINNYDLGTDNNQVEIVIADNTVISGDDEDIIKTDLLYTTFTADTDLAIDSVLYDDYYTAEQENKLDTTILVANKGKIFTRDIKIQLMDNQEVVDEYILNRTIRPGECCEIDQTFILPDIVEKEKYYSIKVVDINNEDTDIDNNQKNIEVGFSNLEFEEGEHYSLGNIHVYSVNVINNGPVSTTGTVEVHKGTEDGAVVDTIELEELKTGEIQNVCVVVNSEEVDWEEYCKAYYLTLKANNVERDIIQNSAMFYVDKEPEENVLLPCTITFSSTQDTIGDLPEVIVGALNDKIEISDPLIEREGYKFVGWSDGNTVLNVNDEYTLVGDVELSAVWEEANDSELYLCHHFGEYQYNNDVTCRDNGTKTRICTVCGYEQTVDDANHGALGHDYKEIDGSAKVATCSDNGKEADKKCSRCGDVIDGKVIQALGHNYGTPIYTWSADNGTCTATKVCENDNAHNVTETVNTTNEVTKGATCEEKGTITYTAIFTNTDFTEQTKDVNTDALGHEYGTPTYTWSDDGKSCTASATCSNDPEHVVTEKATISGNITTPATCKEKGKTTYTATFTNTIFATQTKVVEDVEKLTIHTPAEAVRDKEVAATCTTAGSYEEVVYCSVCGKELSRETKTVSAPGHDWGEWTEKTSATETTEGVEERVCKTDASHTETRAIPMLSHTHVLVKVEAKVATCAKTGNIEYWTCEGCNKLFADKNGKTEINTEDTITAKISHTPAASTKENETAATCENDGSYKEVVKCSICGEEISRKTVTVEALGHDWGEWVQTKAPTETTEGELTRTCKNDSTHKETKAIPVTTHEHNISFVDEMAATCTTHGIKAHYICSVCGLLFEDEAGTKMIMDEQSLVIKSGHKGGTATCIHKAVCDVCHEEYGELDPSNHAGETEVKNKVNAACTADGFTGDTYCKDCGELISNGEVITATGHKASPAVKENEVKATCEKEGSYEEVIKCSICGEGMSRKNIKVSAVGHDFGDWKIKKNPTETEEGIEERICKHDSSHKEIRSVAKLDSKSSTDNKGDTIKDSKNKTTENAEQITAEKKIVAPAKVKILAAKNIKKKSIVTSWKKLKDVNGYEVQYALNKKFTKSKKTKTTTKLTLTVKKLKKGKTYYVRVRAYNVDSKGLKVYGKWSAVKKVKVKK